jgi:putative inorganic carbon (hco3(-)) transporter
MNAVSNPVLKWYLLFVVSWFLHLPARVPILGVLHLDLFLVLFLGVRAFSNNSDGGSPVNRVDKLLRILILYSIVTIPFVYWPGSVIKAGLLNLTKAVVFFYFTVAFVRTERDLKRFVFVFLAAQIFRILEPLYLHITQGYWGSQASMSGGTESLERLSGSPYDSVNPNGLAFIICTILPFLYFMQSLSWKHRLAFIGLTPLLVYALLLTGSRSGLIAMGIVYVAIVIKSHRRGLLLATGIIAVIVGFSGMSSDMQDRYLSIFGDGQKNAGTAEERLDGMQEQFLVVLHRPIFGHGLGTSPEANYHFTSAGPYAGRALPAHNLYLEVAQELGLVGLIIYIAFMKSIVQGFVESRRMWSQIGVDTVLSKLIDAMQVWIAMNIVFSFASYGLSSYDWYLFGGLSIVTQRIGRNGATINTGMPPLPSRASQFMRQGYDADQQGSNRASQG